MTKGYLKFAKPTVVSALLILALGTCRADSDSALRPAPRGNEKRLYYGIGGSTVMCVASIALSRDSGKAAAIGVPILIGGNLLAVKLFHKHPRLAGLVWKIWRTLACVLGRA